MIHPTFKGIIWHALVRKRIGARKLLVERIGMTKDFHPIATGMFRVARTSHQSLAKDFKHLISNRTDFSNWEDNKDNSHFVKVGCDGKAFYV